MIATRHTFMLWLVMSIASIYLNPPQLYDPQHSPPVALANAVKPPKATKPCATALPKVHYPLTLDVGLSGVFYEVGQVGIVSH